MRRLILPLLVPAFASADPVNRDTDVRNPPDPGESYRTEMIVADSVATLAVITGVRGNAAGLGVLGLLGYVSAVPLIHLAHGNETSFGRSAALRFVLPAAGTLIGAVIGSRLPDHCAPDQVCVSPMVPAMGVGAIAGAVAAMVVDWTWLSERPASPTHVLPTVVASDRAISVGFVGRL